MKSLSRVRLFETPWTEPTKLLRPWVSPGKNTRVGCHFLLQGIFPTQGSNPGIESGFPALEADALTSEPPGKPRDNVKESTNKKFVMEEKKDR